MNLFAALDDQPPALLSAQLLTTGVFLTAYLFAVTGLLGTKVGCAPPAWRCWPASPSGSC